MAKIGMIGAGSWGIALSWLLSNNGHDVCVWSVLADEIDMLNKEREHKDTQNRLSEGNHRNASQQLFNSAFP